NFREYEDAVTKRNTFAWGQREIHRGLFAIREDASPQGVCAEQPVAASVPIGRKAGIRRMIQDRNGDRVIADSATQHAPVATRSPSRVTFFSITGKVNAVNAGVVQLGDWGWATACVGKDLRLVRRGFQSARHTDAQKAFLVIMEDNFFTLRLQRSYALNASKVWAALKNESRMFLQNE